VSNVRHLVVALLEEGGQEDRALADESTIGQVRAAGRQVEPETGA